MGNQQVVSYDDWSTARGRFQVRAWPFRSAAGRRVGERPVTAKTPTCCASR